MNKFFNRLYEVCLIVFLFGLFLMIIGELFYKPIAHFGFGCFIIGIAAVVIKQFCISIKW